MVNSFEESRKNAPGNSPHPNDSKGDVINKEELKPIVPNGEGDDCKSCTERKYMGGNTNFTSMPTEQTDCSITLPLLNNGLNHGHPLEESSAKKKL